MGEATGGGTTVPAAASAGLAALAALARDGEVPTRMLVLGVARRDGTILASDAFPLAQACRRSPEQVRSCLRRLVSEGLFVRDGTGQAAVYRPTGPGIAALGVTADRIRTALAEDRAGSRWDGHWHLAGFAVPEARRSARDALRERLGALGGAAVHNGLYVSPRAWESDVAATAEELGVGEHLTLAATGSLRVGGVDEPLALAHHLWPLERLAQRYQRFVDRWREVPDRLDALHSCHRSLPDWALLPGCLAMGLAYQGCFDTDPLLPPDLLPRPWPGRAARELLVRTRRAALRLRRDGDRPALFQAFDDLVEAL